VINRNPRGVIQIELQDIKYDPVKVKPIRLGYSRRHNFYMSDQYVTIINRGRMGTFLDFVEKIFEYHDFSPIIVVLIAILLFIIFFF
jgi:hypothetical protein